MTKSLLKNIETSGSINAGEKQIDNIKRGIPIGMPLFTLAGLEGFEPSE